MAELETGHMSHSIEGLEVYTDGGGRDEIKDEHVDKEYLRGSSGTSHVWARAPCILGFLPRKLGLGHNR